MSEATCGAKATSNPAYRCAHAGYRLLIVEDVTSLSAQVTLKRSLEPRMAERIADDIVEVF